MSSKQFLPCGNGNKKVNKPVLILTEPSTTPQEKVFYHTIEDRMGRKTKSLPQVVLPVFLKGRLTNALPSTLVYE
jgi:hypothetical protein